MIKGWFNNQKYIIEAKKVCKCNKKLNLAPNTISAIFKPYQISNVIRKISGSGKSRKISAWDDKVTIRVDK